MKNLLQGLFCLSIFFINTGLCAQTPPVREPDMNKPVLFQNFPEKINCPVSRLSDLLETEVGRNVSVSFTNSQELQGTITSVVSKYDNRLQSVVIKLTNFPGATLSFSRVINDHGIYSYVGRILSFQHGDAYEITLENGQYYFIKKGFYDLVNE